MIRSLGDIFAEEFKAERFSETICSTPECENTAYALVVAGCAAHAYCEDCRAIGRDVAAEEIHAACGQRKTYYYDPGTRVGFWRCDSCYKRYLETASESERPDHIQASRAFTELCPVEYRKPIDRKLLPDPEAFDKVLRWRKGDKSMFLYGRSQRAKTRAGWALLRSLIMAGGKAKPWGVNQFTTEAAQHASAGDIGPWMRKLIEHYDMTLFDDLGKENFTEHSESRFFEYIERLIANHRPFMITSNAIDATLKAKFVDKNTALALMGRIEKHCTTIQFR